MFTNMKKSGFYIFLSSLLVLFSACSDIDNTDGNVVESGEEQFVSAEVIDDINDSVMLMYVRGGIDANATNAFGYKAVKITYKTKDQNDADVNASGLLVIPTVSDAYSAYLASLGKSFSVSMICENHGSIFTEAEAPTNVELSDGAPNYDIATLMTGFAGFAAIIPDYIGYGVSDAQNHPYMLKKASARASLDMIKASMKYMSDTGVILNYQLYISGYSQGGYTAMALAEEVESSFSTVDLKAIAPMSGPYDLVGLGNIEINASRVMVYPAFLAYLADAYAQAYDDLNLSTLVVENNTTLFHSLFDGSKSGIEIQVALGLTDNYGFGTYTADALFKSSFITDYQNNLNNTFKEKLRENITYDWTPKTRMNLIHCIEDEIIPFSMSQTAYDKFIENGVSSENLTLTPLPTSIISAPTPSDPFVHSRCGATAYGAAVKWFDDIRAGRI